MISLELNGKNLNFIEEIKVRNLREIQKIPQELQEDPIELLIQTCKAIYIDGDIDKDEMKDFIEDLNIKEMNKLSTLISKLMGEDNKKK